MEKLGLLGADLDQCENLNIDRITVDSKAFSGTTTASAVVGCNGVKLTSSRSSMRPTARSASSRTIRKASAKTSR
ncbi:MAG: hypothetical protein ACLR8Y_08795 [Alistipes indistinctus]